MFWKRKKDPNSLAFRRQMAERIVGHHVRYVTERRDNVDEVIGREGALALRNDELIVFASLFVTTLLSVIWAILEFVLLILILNNI